MEYFTREAKLLGRGNLVDIDSIESNESKSNFKTGFSIILDGTEQEIVAFMTKATRYGTWVRTPTNPELLSKKRYDFYLYIMKAEEKSSEGEKKKKGGKAAPIYADRADVEEALITTFRRENLLGLSYRKAWTSVMFSVVGDEAREMVQKRNMLEVVSEGKKYLFKIGEERENNNRKASEGLHFVDARTIADFPPARFNGFFRELGIEPIKINRKDGKKNGNVCFEIALRSELQVTKLVTTPAQKIAGLSVTFERRKEAPQGIERSIRSVEDEDSSSSARASKRKAGNQEEASKTPPVPPPRSEQGQEAKGSEDMNQES
jgi:hypothetical protein